MDANLKAAPGEGTATKNQTAVSGENYSSLSVIHCNNSYNIMLAGQRIASFLSYDKAVQFAGEGWYE